LLHYSNNREFTQGLNAGDAEFYENRHRNGSKG
jgi:hypothetical protein